MPPRLMLNPRDDEPFVATATHLVATGADTPQRLQEELRKRYPAAVVRRRDLVGEAGDVWYVYRDGRWVPRGEEG